MNPLVTDIEFAENRVLLEKIYEDFYSKLNKHLTANKGIISNPTLQKLFNQSSKKHTLSANEKRIAQGLFETFLGILVTYNDLKLSNELIRSSIFNSNEDGPVVHFEDGSMIHFFNR